MIHAGPGPVTTARPIESLDPDTIPVRVEHLYNKRTRVRFCDGATLQGWSGVPWDFKPEKICPECVAVVRYLERQGKVRRS